MSDPKWLWPVLGTAAVGIFDSVLAYNALNHGWMGNMEMPYCISPLLYIIAWIIAYIFIIIAWWSLLNSAPSSQNQAINYNFMFLIILILLFHLVLFGAGSFSGALMVAAFLIILSVMVAIQATALGNVAAGILMGIVLIWVVLNAMFVTKLTTLNY